MGDKMQASLRPVDERRCFQLLAAWLDADKQALDLLLDDTTADPDGTPGLLFALLTFTADLGNHTVHDFRSRITEWLVNCAAQDSDDDGEGAS